VDCLQRAERPESPAPSRGPACSPAKRSALRPLADESQERLGGVSPIPAKPASGLWYHIGMGTDHTQQQSSEEQRQARAMSLQKARPPADIAGYTMKRLLGCGAFGEVWIGVDRNTGRQVAIKFYTHRSGVDWALLSSEWRSSSTCPRIATWSSCWTSAGSRPSVLCDGLYRERFPGGSPAPAGPVAGFPGTELFWEMAIGLLHAHGKGVLHCDLKPANVLLDQDHKPRLADFGQSRLSTDQSPALGTLFYMAPEQADLSLPDARGMSTRWARFSTGMLTGEPPFRTAESVTRIEDAEDLRTGWPATGHHSVRLRPCANIGAFRVSIGRWRDHRSVPGCGSGTPIRERPSRLGRDEGPPTGENSTSPDAVGLRGAIVAAVHHGALWDAGL